MKKSRQWQRTRLWVEELETRYVLSTVVPAVSTNWSGYAALPLASSKATFSAVSGSWTVPAVTGSGTAYTSVWVGLDGYSSNTVEQIGTDSDIVNGVPTYYAWYETYPNPSVNIVSYSTKTKTGVTVNAGDVITASVTYTSGKFTLTLTDTTDNESFSPPAQTVKNAQRSSAEWIVEAPSSYNGVLPLSDFGSVNFTNAQATLTGATSSGPIDSSSWQNTPINMETSRGVAEATTGALSDATNPSSFTVTYDAPPATPTRPAPPPHHPGWWWWYSTNNAAQADGMLMVNSTSAPAFSSSASFAAAPQAQAPASLSTVAPPVAIPLNPGAAPWMSLAGPAGAAASEEEMEADAVLLDVNIPLARDLFHPAAFAMTTATPNAGVELLPPPQALADSVPHNALLVAEAPAVSSAPPARQPEPRGNFVTRTMGKAFWLVAGLAFVSHRAFSSGKRQTALHQDENERARA